MAAARSYRYGTYYADGPLPNTSDTFFLKTGECLVSEIVLRHAQTPGRLDAAGIRQADLERQIVA